MIRLISIDPGLDDTSYALWAADAIPLSLDRVASAFLCTATITTKTSAPLEQRMQRITEALSQVIAAHQPTLVVIEQPAYSGVYARMRSRARTAAPIHAAGLAREREVGGLIAGLCSAHDIAWQWAPPSSIRVKQRVAAVQALGIRGRTNPDQRAAILIGVAVLTDHRRRRRK